MSSPKYICLCNPHDGEWKVFDYCEDLEPYAPNYGCPITTGNSPEDAIANAKAWGIDPDEVEVHY